MTGQLARPARRSRLVGLRRWWLNRQLQSVLRSYWLVSEELSNCYQSGGDAAALEKEDAALAGQLRDLRARIDSLDAAS